MRGRFLPAALVLAVLAPRAAAQDTVQVIRPEATGDSARAVLPESVVNEVIAHYNDSLTTRILGPFVLPRGAELSGPVAVFGGALVVRGRIAGRVTVINSYLLIEGGVIEGPVLVVGGQILIRSGGQLLGTRREFRPLAPLIRTSAGLLAPRPPPRSLGEMASAHRSFETPYFRTTVSLEPGRTYNRVEGFPIVLGPTFSREGLPDVEPRLDLRAIVWTAPDRTDRRGDFGYTASLELGLGAARRVAVGAIASRLIKPIEEQPLSPGEIGLAAVLLQRDYRDYYQAQGIGAFARWEVGRFSLHGSLARESEQSVPATDPFSVVREEGWRPNPLIDDGHFLTVRLGLRYDSRQRPNEPGSGWLLDAWWERTRSNDASPLTLPPEVRDPVPPGPFASERIWLDLRRYQRLNPDVRVGVRLVAGGWVNGDPLPVQRRFSMGGPDLLPGYPFRRQNCMPGAFADPAIPALCDRMMAGQLEIKARARFGLTAPARHPWLGAAQRLFSVRDPDIVIMANAGKAWVAGEGPGRVPSNRIPLFREWDKDVGIGLDFGGIAVYAAQPLTRGLPLLLSFRLQQRF